jgi:hypothetical protein
MTMLRTITGGVVVIWLCGSASLPAPQLLVSDGKDKAKREGMFVAEYTPKGVPGKAFPVGAQRLVLRKNGIHDVRPSLLTDEMIRQVLNCRVVHNSKEICAVRVLVLDDITGKDGIRLTMAEFAASVQRIKSLSNPDLPTYLEIKYGY